MTFRPYNRIMEKIKDRNILIQKIATDIAKEKGRAYFVGGYVRDLLLKRESKDIDIEVHGLSPEKLEAILSNYTNYDLLGKSFGIYSLRYHHIDIALPRKEKKIGLKHNDFRIDVDPYIGTYASSLRRDFTINALMMDVLTKEIIDHFNGLKDLENKVIRHINDMTFPEDPLRVLRAARFSATLDFKIAKETIDLSKKIDLSFLAKERVLTETNKALLGLRPASYFYALKDMKQLFFFYPELEKMIGLEQAKTYHDEDAFDHVMLVVEEAAKYKDLAMMPRYFMYAALFHDIGKISQCQRHTIIGQAIAKEALERFTNEKYLLKYVQKAIGLHMDVLNMYKDKSKDAKIIRLLDKFKYPKDLLLLALCDIKGRKSNYYSDEMIDDYILWAKKSLKIYEEFKDRPHLGGRDILALGYRGPIVKKILARARYLEAAIQDEKEVLKIIRKEFP